MLNEVEFEPLWMVLLLHVGANYSEIKHLKLLCAFLSSKENLQQDTSSSLLSRNLSGNQNFVLSSPVPADLTNLLPTIPEHHRLTLEMSQHLSISLSMSEHLLLLKTKEKCHAVG